VRQVEGPTGCITQYGYGANHLLTSITDPEGFQTTYTYDVAARVLTRSVAGNLGRYTYVTQSGQPNTIYTDPLGNVWTNALDTQGNLLRQVDPLGAVQSVTYDTPGQPTLSQDPLNFLRTVNYDTNGRPILQV